LNTFDKKESCQDKMRQQLACSERFSGALCLMIAQPRVRARIPSAYACNLKRRFSWLLMIIYKDTIV